MVTGEARKLARRSAGSGMALQAGAVLGEIVDEVDEVKKVAASIAEISIAAQEQAKDYRNPIRVVESLLRTTPALRATPPYPRRGKSTTHLGSLY